MNDAASTSSWGTDPHQPSSVSTPLQSYYPSISRESSESTPSQGLGLTPFRPMQPREFALGSNLKKLRPAMPLLTLPADMSGAKMMSGIAPTVKKGNGGGAQTAPKRGSSENKSDDVKKKNARNDAGTVAFVINTPLSEGPRRSSLYSRASAGPSSAMGRISEEEGSGSELSSGMSSGYSASFDRVEEFEEDEVSADVPLTDEGDQEFLMNDADRNGISVDAALQLLTADEGSRGELGRVEHRQRVTSRASDTDYASDNLLKEPNSPTRGQSRPRSDLLSTSHDGEESTQSAHSKESQSSSDSSGGFLSWDQSRKSDEYIQAVIEMANQQQQHADSFSQPHDQQSYTPKNSNDSHPSQQMQPSYQVPRPSPSATTQSYRRSSSQESNGSISSNSPTPFRPMLPRELLRENNLRRLHPTMPFPILPANVVGPAAIHSQISSKGIAGNRD